MNNTNSTPVEALIEFVRQRRARMGLGHNALARASGIDPGSLANLMVGRVKNAPTLTTLQKLAGGLQVDPEVLIRIASGYHVDFEAALDSSFMAERQPPRPTSAETPVEGRYPLTPEESRILSAAERVGLTWHLDRHTALLDIAPSDRKWIFRDLESVLHSLDVHTQLRKTQSEPK